MLLTLKDHQLAIVTATADTLTAEKRSVFLERVASQLRVRGSRFSNAELEKLIRPGASGAALASCGRLPPRGGQSRGGERSGFTKFELYKSVT